MTSYQNDSSKGSYESINGSTVHPDSRKKNKWIYAGVVLAIAAISWGKSIHKPAGQSTQIAMKKSGLPINEDGSVMLFDKLSEWIDQRMKLNWISYSWHVCNRAQCDGKGVRCILSFRTMTIVCGFHIYRIVPQFIIDWLNSLINSLIDLSNDWLIDKHQDPFYWLMIF